MKFLTLLTWFGHLEVTRIDVKVVPSLEYTKNEIFESLVHFGCGIDGNIRQAFRIWLCQTMVPEMTMNGSFFSDKDLYTELCLHYIRTSNSAGMR